MSYFPHVNKIKYEGPDSKNPLAFRYYDADKLVLGKPMKEHLRFAAAYWHTMNVMGADMFGHETFKRNWDGQNEMETAINKVEAFFELLEKLGIEYFCFHDVDIAPQGESLEEFFRNLDEITDLIKEKMEKTGVKLLWNTANLFSNKRYLKGAATATNSTVYAYAAAQVKKGLDLAKKLGAENYVFWGGREGYESLLNTDYGLEQDNMAYFFQIAVDYAEEIGLDVQFLLEPKPMEPSTHQYDFDAATTLAFIQKYNLEGKFKLNLEANHATLAGHTFQHEIRVARENDALGSLDANHGEVQLGWDTDEFPFDLYETTLAMYEVLKNGGLAPGGINFDAKLRRTSVEQNDLFVGHIQGMDNYARGLLAAAKIKEEGFFDEILEKRYSTFKEGIGKKIVDKETNLKELAEYAMESDDVVLESDHLEFVKSRLNDYLV